MAKENLPKNTKITNTKQDVKTQKNKSVVQENDLLSIFDRFFEKRSETIFWITLLITLLFGLLLFDLKVSRGGDDSTYIIRASDLIHDFKFPSFQGPLYPMILSIFVAFLGINLPVLKLISFVFLLLHFYLFYTVFTKKIPASLLIFNLLLLAINPYILYYGSQTYSEALFMMEQMLLFLVVFKYFISNENETIDIRKDYKKFLLLGGILFVMTITKSVSYASILAVITFFAIQKYWKSIAYMLSSFAGFFILWEIIKRTIWKASDLQFATQGSILLNKEAYSPKDGKEDLMGFVGRFFENSNLYLSKHFYKFLGLRPEITDPIIPLTILTFLIFGLAIYFVFKRNKYLLFTGLYAGILTGITFIVLQKKWESGRMILPYFPFALLFIFAGFHYMLKTKTVKILQFAIPLLVIILFFTTFSVTIDKVNEQQKELRANLRGDMLNGFTTDWVNFLKMSQWVAQNIPPDQVVASRKPDISFIYSNRRFWGMFSVPSENADTLLNILKKNKVRYVIMASLRKYEAQKTEYTINTEMRFLYYIQQKYPDIIKPVHQIGEDEQATLFEIKY